MKQVEIDKNVREELKIILSDALKATIKSYDDYMQGRMNSSEKESFLENHKTGKIALSNIEILMKLASATHIPDDNGDGMELAALLQQASAELDKFEKGAGDE